MSADSYDDTAAEEDRRANELRTAQIAERQNNIRQQAPSSKSKDAPPSGIESVVKQGSLLSGYDRMQIGVAMVLITSWGLTGLWTYWPVLGMYAVRAFVGKDGGKIPRYTIISWIVHTIFLVLCTCLFAFWIIIVGTLGYVIAKPIQDLCSSWGFLIKAVGSQICQ